MRLFILLAIGLNSCTPVYAFSTCQRLLSGKTVLTENFSFPPDQAAQLYQVYAQYRTTRSQTALTTLLESTRHFLDQNQIQYKLNGEESILISTLGNSYLNRLARAANLHLNGLRLAIDFKNLIGRNAAFSATENLIWLPFAIIFAPRSALSTVVHELRHAFQNFERTNGRSSILDGRLLFEGKRTAIEELYTHALSLRVYSTLLNDANFLPSEIEKKYLQKRIITGLSFLRDFSIELEQIYASMHESFTVLNPAEWQLYSNTEIKHVPSNLLIATRSFYKNGQTIDVDIEVIRGNEILLRIDIVDPVEIAEIKTTIQANPLEAAHILLARLEKIHQIAAPMAIQTNSLIELLKTDPQTVHFEMRNLIRLVQSRLHEN